MHYLKESVYRIQKIDQHSFLQRPLSIDLFMIALSVSEIAVKTRLNVTLTYWRSKYTCWLLSLIEHVILNTDNNPVVKKKL